MVVPGRLPLRVATLRHVCVNRGGNLLKVSSKSVTFAIMGFASQQIGTGAVHCKLRCRAPRVPTWTQPSRMSRSTVTRDRAVQHM